MFQCNSLSLFKLGCIATSHKINIQRSSVLILVSNRMVLFLVGIWCHLLGDIQWWEGAICRDRSIGAAPEVGEWIQNGDAKQFGMY